MHIPKSVIVNKKQCLAKEILFLLVCSSGSVTKSSISALLTLN